MVLCFSAWRTPSVTKPAAVWREFSGAELLYSGLSSDQTYLATRQTHARTCVHTHTHKCSELATHEVTHFTCNSISTFELTHRSHISCSHIQYTCLFFYHSKDFLWGLPLYPIWSSISQWDVLNVLKKNTHTENVLYLGDKSVPTKYN